MRCCQRFQEDDGMTELIVGAKKCLFVLEGKPECEVRANGGPRELNATGDGSGLRVMSW
jgi:hypothetical protein